MDTRLLIFIPVLIYLLVSTAFPHGKEINIRRPWFEPPYYILYIGWIGMYIILGYLLYRIRSAGLDEIMIKMLIVIFLSYLFTFCYHRTSKYCLIVIMGSLLTSYMVYNSIFLSELTRDEDSTLELNLMSTYIIWITFVLAIVLSSKEKH